MKLSKEQKAEVKVGDKVSIRGLKQKLLIAGTYGAGFIAKVDGVDSKTAYLLINDAESIVIDTPIVEKSYIAYLDNGRITVSEKDRNADVIPAVVIEDFRSARMERPTKARAIKELRANVIASAKGTIEFHLKRAALYKKAILMAKNAKEEK